LWRRHFYETQTYIYFSGAYFILGVSHTKHPGRHFKALFLENIHVSNCPDTISPDFGVRAWIWCCQNGWKKWELQGIEEIIIGKGG
jgi:hypothetical protein